MIRSTISQSRKRPRRKRTARNAEQAPVAVISVPVEKGFHFFTGVNEPTGICATSMTNFLDQLKRIDLRSLQFHLERNDFSRWLREVVNDSSLADDFDGLQAVKFSGKEIRRGLLELTQKRYGAIADAQAASIAPIQ